MSKRPPAPAPKIEGFTFDKVIGSGGFADVYLYKQHSPRRDVAVKVLISEVAGTDAAERLSKEADSMAGLSQHQNIVTVFQSGISSDGRPYMVMEYYSRPALSQGPKQSQRSLASALSIGIQLAGAVESAHISGILHRDIKPSNILLDKFGRPVLGDFGIAMTNAEAQRGGAQGLSIPWSPPESFSANLIPSVQSDIWSLAATIYALLTGRPPFEDVGGDNRPLTMMDRITNSPYRPTAREDVPPSLEQVLKTAMAKSPDARYQSVKAFGTALREIEQDLKLPQTVMDIIKDDAEVGPTGGEDGPGGTELRSIVVIDPNRSDPAEGTLNGDKDPVSPDRTVLRLSTEPEQVEPKEDEIEPADKKPLWRRLIWVAVAVLMIVAVSVVVTQLSAPEDPSPESNSPSSSAQDPLPGGSPLAPTQMTGVVDGNIAHFTWTNPSPQDGDLYTWQVIGGAQAARISEPAVDVAIPEGQATVCINVRILRSGVGSSEGQVCAT